MHTVNRSLLPLREPAPSPVVAALGTISQPDVSSSKLNDYARCFASDWRAVLLAGLLGAVLGVLLHTAVPKRYSARAVLEVRSPNERFLNREAFDPRSMNSAVGSESYLQTQLQILESDQLARNVIKGFAALPDGGLALAQGFQLPEDASLQRGVESLRKAVKTKVLPQTRLIEVVARTTSPGVSADLANAMANQFMEEEAAAQHAAMDETRRMLERELSNLKTRLLQSQDELNRYLRSTGLLVGARNENLKEGQLLQTQNELTLAHADRIRTQSHFEQASSNGPEAITDVLNDATLKDYRANLAALYRELADLSTTLAPKHYRIQKLKAQIEELEKARAAHQSKIVDKIRNEFESARRREKLLEDSYGRAALLLTDQTAKGLRYIQLKGEMETNRQIYEGMLARLKETEVIAAIGGANIRLVDRAWPSSRANGPNLWQSAFLGLGGGLLAGMLLAIGRQSPGKALREPDSVAALLQVPSLAVGKTGPAPISRHRTADLEAWSPAALEAYSSVIASVETLTPHSAWEEPRGRCLVVSSPGDGDGKTVTTVGLGVAMARCGKRVIVVNADLRQPRLHELLHVDNSEGLADLLADADPSTVMDFVVPTPVRGLWVLPGGPAVGETMQLLDSQLLPAVLSQLRERFDLILVDTPPMLQSADARLISRHADGVVLVVRSGHTDRADVLAARQRLASHGLKLAAVVLNDGPSGGGGA